MVAINIQSLDDIISAYLKYLRFSDKQARRLAGDIKDRIGVQENVIEAVDRLLLPVAKNIFSDLILTDAQAVSLYKFCFLQAGGAKKWGAEFFKEVPSVPFRKAIRQEIVINAPVYRISHMKVQEIEPVIHGGFFHKLWHRKGIKNER